MHVRTPKIKALVQLHRRRILLALWLALCLSAAYALGFYAYLSGDGQPALGRNGFSREAKGQATDNRPPSVVVHRPSSSFDLFWEAYRILRDEFYGELPPARQLAYGALRGALSTLGDPYSVFVEPQPHEMEKADLRGSFGGIGANLSRDAQGRVVLHPLPDSPAAQAGVQDGDILLAVDGLPLTPTLSLEAITLWLRGPVGEPITLTLLRGDGPPVSITVIRAEIELPSVTWHQLQTAPQVGYIGISRFSERTDQELRRALLDLRSQGVQRLILDLRDNSGGLLQAAVDVAGEFLPNEVILIEERRNHLTEVRRSGSGGLATDLPLVVLVNRGTASAAEIVAGALQDHSRARLIGETTFGKGSVQLIFELSDGSSLHITAARWLTPGGHQLDGVGLTPDIVQVGTASAVKGEAADPTDPADAQLTLALRLLQTEEW
jgi:carboxyl-terminal processing protease